MFLPTWLVSLRLTYLVARDPFIPTTRLHSQLLLPYAPSAFEVTSSGVGTVPESKGNIHVLEKLVGTWLRLRVRSITNTFKEDAGRGAHNSNMEVHTVSSSHISSDASVSFILCHYMGTRLQLSVEPFYNLALACYAATQRNLPFMHEPSEAQQSLYRWLNAGCRCFGDKGDVEDITEGIGTHSCDE